MGRMQIGRDRKGFYGSTFLENAFACDMPKVEKLVPDWKPRVPRETVWFCSPKHFGGQGRMIAAMVDPDRAFTMVSLKDWQSLETGGRAHEGIWSFTLEPLPDGQTRLTARLRGGTPPALTSQVVGRWFWSPLTSSWSRRCSAQFPDLSEKS
jgi:hypothetical protein